MIGSKDDKEKEPKWPHIRELFSSIIEPADGWLDADCLGDLSEMVIHFLNAFPDQVLTNEDMQLALHDMGVTFERNEHNNKFYYLAKWR